MKRTLFSLLLLVCLSPVFAGQWKPISSATPVPAKVELISSDISTSVIRFGVGGFFLNEVNTPNGTEYTISVGGGTAILQQGAPDLPKLTASVIIPDQALMDVRVISSSFVEFSGIRIAPSKGNLTRDINPSTVPFEYGRHYTENRFFPAEMTSLRNPFILRDYRGQTVVVNPFEYNPVTQTLRVYTAIEVKLYQQGTSQFNAISRNQAPARIDAEFSGIYNQRFLNMPQVDYTPLEEYGRMLVISYGPFMQAMQPFVDWKNSKGIQTEMVDVASIGATATAIKSYVSNYYATNGLTFLVLVGDSPQIPTNNGGNLGGPSDNAYGYLAGNDHYPDVFVGRFSAETVDHVNTMVTRTLEYERNPYLGSGWMPKGIGIGSDQGPGDDNEYDYQHIRNIRTKLMDFTYSEVAELYDGSQGGEDQGGNPTPAMVAEKVNAGSTIINYCGHGSETSWGTTGFSNTNVNQLTNNHMWPFIFSVACVNGSFVGTTCFAEAWLRAKNSAGPTGAVATVMSTINQSWDPPMDAQDEMDDLLVGTFPDNVKRTFGGLTMNGCARMNDDFGSGGDEMTDTWNIFGDPSVFVRTDMPGQLAVTHENQVFIGSSSFTVNCTTDGALVGLSMNNQFLTAGFVNNGSVTLNFPTMQAPDTLHLVVTAFNMLPYETDIAIIPNNGPYLIYYGNQVHDINFNNNGSADYGETVTLDLSLNNIGIMPAMDVSLLLTSADPYIVLNDTTEIFSEIPANDTTSIPEAFGFTLMNTIPDMHGIPFHYVATSGADSWAGDFTVIAHAGRLHVSGFDITDQGGNNNGKADPGETFDLMVGINNNGSASTTNVFGQLSINDPWVTLISTPVQSYGTLESGQTEMQSYVLTASEDAPPGHIVSCAFLMIADLGISTPTYFNIVIGQIPVAVIDLDQNLNSGPLMLNALNANNVFAEYKNAIPADLSGYQTLFVALGTSDNKHVLSSTEGQQLADFLSNGGKLYMEGGDTWYYDPKTAVHTLFKANGVMDGSNDLSQQNGQIGTFTEGLTFAFGGDNEFIDHIAPLSPAFSLFKNSTPLYIDAVAYDQGNYRTIASAFEFGGLINGEFPNTRNEYMRRIIEFFGVLSTPLTANFMGSPVNVCEGGSVTFSNFSTGGANSYQWSFPGGDPATSIEPEPMVSYASPGLYDVTLIVNNGMYSDTLMKPEYVWVEYCTGMGETDRESLRIYPNPAGSVVYITTGTLEGLYSLQLTDASGRNVYNTVHESSDAPESIDTSDLPSGIYSVTIRTLHELFYRKLVINH